MPELRKDPILDRWVIMAPERSMRLAGMAAPDPELGLLDGAKDCPFCEGCEPLTPHEITACRAPGTARDAPGWRVRVVPNKFPALSSACIASATERGMYHSLAGVGAHEVVIESPRHVLSTTDLSEPELTDVLWIYRERLLALKREPRLLHAMVFKNVGAAAGATQPHTHSQVLATPIVPPAIRESLASSQAFYDRRHCCPWCELLAEELMAQSRIVLDDEAFMAFCPYASRVPYEVWLVPKQHGSHFETISSTQAWQLASALRRMIGMIEAVSVPPAYNYFIHTAPLQEGPMSHAHWRIEILPRQTQLAGFEWGSGSYINVVLPETAAEKLRDAAFRLH